MAGSHPRQDVPSTDINLPHGSATAEYEARLSELVKGLLADDGDRDAAADAREFVGVVGRHGGTIFTAAAGALGHRQAVPAPDRSGRLNFPGGY